MKRALIFLLMLLILLVNACSEKDNNPTDTNIYGYKLDQFISKSAVSDLVDPTAADTTDFRSLFAYEIVSADSVPWSPRLSSYAGYDLPWETHQLGFIVPSDGNRTWFPPALSLPGAFKVRNTGCFKLYRKVDVVTNRDSKMAELKGLNITTLSNWIDGTEDAIKLSDLLQGIAVYDTVRLVAVDGYTKEYTAEQINDGYYLLDSEVTTFPNFNESMQNSQKKFKKLARMEVVGVNSQEFEFPLAVHDKACLSVPVPENLNDYEATVMTDY